MLEGGSLWAGVISGGIAQMKDTEALNKGRMEKKEYLAQTTQNVTGAFGVMAGVEYGAVLGTSILPGIGTAAGAILGGLFGDKLGRTVGQFAGNVLVDNKLLQGLLHPVESLKSADIDVDLQFGNH